MATSDLLTVTHLSRRDLSRLFARIDVDGQTGCWLWIGTSISIGGYGRVRHNHRHELIHRLLYAWLVEPVPRGRANGAPVLDHIVCDNPQCCNPAHLKLVSNRDNCLRASAGPIIKNAFSTVCVRGHSLPKSPNDKHKRKRYCKECNHAASAARLTNSDTRAALLDYLSRYNKRRMNGPRREELLERQRESTRRYRDRMVGH